MSLCPMMRAPTGIPDVPARLLKSVLSVRRNWGSPWKAPPADEGCVNAMDIAAAAAAAADPSAAAAVGWSARDGEGPAESLEDQERRTEDGDEGEIIPWEVQLHKRCVGNHLAVGPRKARRRSYGHS